MTKNAVILSENATNATRDPETGVATTPGELAVTKPWKQRWLLFLLRADGGWVSVTDDLIIRSKHFFYFQVQFPTTQEAPPWSWRLGEWEGERS